MLGTMGCEKVAPAGDTASLAAQYRAEFPVADELIYLNHAAVAPLCRAAAEAMKALADDACRFGSLHYDKWMESYSGPAAGNCAVDQRFGRRNRHRKEHIGGRRHGGDRARLESRRPGDRVPRRVSRQLLSLAKRLEARGVEITWLSIYDPLEKIAAAIPGARLLAISHVNYLSGYRVDLDSIGGIVQSPRLFFLCRRDPGHGCVSDRRRGGAHRRAGRRWT